jgi:hypothetical protein
MKKMLLALITFLAFAGGAPPQQHAPTADVCRADANLWDNQEDFAAYRAERKGFLTGRSATSPIGVLSVKELEGRMQEMTDCYSSDGPRTTYFIVLQFYTSVAYDRGVDFIARHGLVDKFYQEDAAGKR